MNEMILKLNFTYNIQISDLVKKYILPLEMK